MDGRFELDIVICSEIKGKDKIYSISSIQVPNVVTQGKTIEEAKQRLRQALNLYFEDMPEQREQILLSCRREAPMISRIFL
jgi:predicted RNase H-like HicB family nuclease